MSTKQRGQKWTQEKANKAESEHYYIKVAEKGGKLQLSGAEKKFAENPNFVYVPSPYRVAGDRSDISTLFTNLGVSSDDTNHILNTAYTAKNYQNNPNFEKEVEMSKNYKNNQVLTTNNSSRLTLDQVPAILEAHRGQAPAKPTRKPRSEGEGTPTRGGRVRPLAERLEELKSGKVLDVSNMSETGAGVKAIDEPKPGSKKIGVPGLRVVSSKPENFYTAVTSLGPEYEHFAETYRQRLAVPVTSSPKKKPSPVKKTVEKKPSPVKSKPTVKPPTPKEKKTIAPKLAGMPNMAMPKTRVGN